MSPRGLLSLANNPEIRAAMPCRGAENGLVRPHSQYVSVSMNRTIKLTLMGRSPCRVLPAAQFEALTFPNKVGYIEQARII